MALHYSQLFQLQTDLSTREVLRVRRIDPYMTDSNAFSGLALEDLPFFVTGIIHIYIVGPEVMCMILTTNIDCCIFNTGDYLVWFMPATQCPNRSDRHVFRYFSLRSGRWLDDRSVGANKFGMFLKLSTQSCPGIY